LTIMGGQLVVVLFLFRSQYLPFFQHSAAPQWAARRLVSYRRGGDGGAADVAAGTCRGVGIKRMAAGAFDRWQHRIKATRQRCGEYEAR